MCIKEVFDDYLEKKKTMTPLELAKYVCIKQHAKVKRKYTNDPYHVHPFEVMGIVKTVPTHTLVMLIAALLHDVVEDTDMTLEEIFILFGELVASLVEQLTDISKLTDGNRKLRKEMDRAHTKLASPEAKTIKLADLISNSKTIKLFDVLFWKIFSHEKKLLLMVLTEGDPVLYERAKAEL